MGGQRCEQATSSKRRRTTGLLQIGHTLDEVSACLATRISAEDAEVLRELRNCESAEDDEAKHLIAALQARHGAGFWQPEMFHCTNAEYMERLHSWGRDFALSMVGKPWPASIYRQQKLQVAYIQEYFKARSEAVHAELTRLKQLSTEEPGADVEDDLPPDVVPRLWDFFEHILQRREVKIVDLAGGPGCCAAGAWHFFEHSGDLNEDAVQATVLDPVEEWSWCSQLLGVHFQTSATLSDMLLEDCSFSADVILLGWVMEFADKSFWERLEVAFTQRTSYISGCNPQALVIVLDRGLDQLRCKFYDRRQQVLRKPGVLWKDYGANVCYSWLLGDPSPDFASQGEASDREA